MQKMTQKDMVVGTLVAPMPSHLTTEWAKRYSWPQQIVEVVNPHSFRLSHSTGGWGTEGLYVVDNSIEENE